MNPLLVTLRSYSSGFAPIEDPEEVEIAEAITNFPRLAVHHRNDIYLYAGEHGDSFSSRLNLCLAVEGLAMVTYSDSRDSQVYVLMGNRSSDGTFVIDDGGGEAIELDRKFLVSRHQAIEVACDYLAEPVFDLHNEPDDWMESPLLW